MGILNWLFGGCWHDFHKTGNYGKRIVGRHGEFGNEIYIMVEGKCCQCGEIKWIPQYFRGDHGSVDTYADSDYPELSYV